jgi:hypothetical protein
MFMPCANVKSTLATLADIDPAIKVVPYYGYALPSQRHFSLFMTMTADILPQPGLETFDFSGLSLYGGPKCIQKLAVSERNALIRCSARTIHRLWMEGYDLEDFPPGLWMFSFATGSATMVIPPDYLIRSARPHNIHVLINLLAGWQNSERNRIPAGIMRRFLCCLLKPESLPPGRFNHFIEEINARSRRMQPGGNAAALHRYAFRHFRSAAARTSLARQIAEQTSDHIFQAAPHEHIPALSRLTGACFAINVGMPAKSLKTMLPEYTGWQIIAALNQFLFDHGIPMPPVMVNHLHHQQRRSVPTLCIHWTGSITTAARWLSSCTSTGNDWYSMAGRWSEAVAKLERQGFTLASPVLPNIWMALGTDESSPVQVWLNPVSIIPTNRFRRIFADSLREKLDMEIHAARKK